MGLGVLCFTIGGPESVKPLIELYKNEIENAEPVGDFVNDNIMVTTQLLCLEDGQRARTARREHGHGLPPQPVVAVPRHVPAPRRRARCGPILPDPTPEADRRGDQGRRYALRHARRSRGRDPEVRRRRCRPGRVRSAVVDDGPRPSPSRRSRRSASTCSRSSTPTPCTARPASAKRPRSRPRDSGRSARIVPVREPTFNLADLWETLCDAEPGRRVSRRGIRAAHPRVARRGREPDRQPSRRVRHPARRPRRHLRAESRRIRRGAVRLLEVRRGAGQHQLALRRRRIALRRSTTPNSSR